MEQRYLRALHDYDGPRLTDVQRLLILVLAGYCGKRGFCWPKVSTLARVTGLTDSTVRANTAALERMGLLEKKRQRRRGAGNLYRLTGPFDDAGGGLDDLPL